MKCKILKNFILVFNKCIKSKQLVTAINKPSVTLHCSVEMKVDKAGNMSRYKQCTYEQGNAY